MQHAHHVRALDLAGGGDLVEEAAEVRAAAEDGVLGEFDRVLCVVRSVSGQEDHAEGPHAEGVLQPDSVGAIRPRDEHAGNGKVHSCRLSADAWMCAEPWVNYICGRRCGGSGAAYAGRSLAMSSRQMKIALSIRCLPNRAGMTPVLAARSCCPRCDPWHRLGVSRLDDLAGIDLGDDPVRGFDAAILTSERHVAAPLEAFVDHVTRGEPEEQGEQVAGIAADQRAGQGQAVGTAGDELGERVGLGCLSALVLVEAALP